MHTRTSLVVAILLTACAAAATQRAEPRVETPALPAMDTDESIAGKMPVPLRSRGDASIFVRCVDPWKHTGIATRVRLWRLRVPAGGGWTGGDESIGDFQIPADGGTIGGLAEGRYRLQLPEQSRGENDPPAFDVQGNWARITANLDLPHKAHSFLRVLDENGRPLTAGEVVRTGAYHESTWANAPEWAHPRHPDTEEGPVVRGPLRGHSYGPEPFEVTASSASDRGFDLGEIVRHSQAEVSSYWVGVRFPGRSSVGASAPREIGAGFEYVGVSVPFERILTCIRLPDGSKPEARSLRVTEAYAEPTSEERLRIDGGVAGMRVHTWVACEGYEPLAFDWSIGTENVPRVLKPAASK